MTTKRDLTAHKGEPTSSARRNQLGESRGEDGPDPVKGRERREKPVYSEEDPDAGLHDA
jgi:hypothetical protein